MFEAKGKWSVADNTAGGGTNEETVGNNPQWKMEVTNSDGRNVKVVLCLKQTVA